MNSDLSDNRVYFCSFFSLSSGYGSVRGIKLFLTQPYVRFHYATHAIARYMPSSYVCLFVTSRCSTKTAKRRITQTTLHDSPGTLLFFFLAEDFGKTQTRSPPTEAPNAGGVS